MRAAFGICRTGTFLSGASRSGAFKSFAGLTSHGRSGFGRADLWRRGNFFFPAPSTRSTGFRGASPLGSRTPRPSTFRPSGLGPATFGTPTLGTSPGRTGAFGFTKGEIRFFLVRKRTEFVRFLRGWLLPFLTALGCFSLGGRGAGGAF